jgi:hypothetical protein
MLPMLAITGRQGMRAHTQTEWVEVLNPAHPDPAQEDMVKPLLVRQKSRNLVSHS